MKGKFIGTYNRALDSKGRIMLPPSFLKALESDGEIKPFWLTGLYGRLTGYTQDRWEEIVEKLCSVKLPSLKLSNFKTKLVGMAQEISPDSQGRIRAPQSLIREAGLGKEIVIVGILDKFEIWDQARFDAISVEDVSDELIRFGIDLSL